MSLFWLQKWNFYTIEEDQFFQCSRTWIAHIHLLHSLITYLFVCLFTYFLSHHLEGIPEGQQCCWLLHCSASGSPVTLPPTGKYWTTIPRPCAFYALIDITRGALVEMLLCLSSICFFSITHLCVVAHFTLLLNDFRKVTQQGRTRAEQDRKSAILFAIIKAPISLDRA